MNIRSLSKITPLLLVILLDSMGMGLLIPILTAIMILPGHHNIATHFSPHSREMYYGLIMSVYMITWFLSASILGDLSDQVGRNRVLVACLSAAVVSYALTGVATDINSILLLIIGRVVGGMASGSQAIAQAAIVDISDPHNKAHHLGLIIMISSLGYIVGPILGGLLSNPQLAHWLTLSSPLYFASLLSLINVVLLLAFFKETHLTPKKIQIIWSRSVSTVASCFKHKELRFIALVLTGLMFAWGIYYSFISIFLSEDFHFNTSYVAYYLSLLAGGFAIGSGLLAGQLSKLNKLKQTALIAILLCAIFIGATALGSITLAWLMSFCVGASLGISYALILTLASNQVSDDEQGWVMGVTTSLATFAIGTSLLITSAATAWGSRNLILASGIIMVISAVLCLLAMTKTGG